MTRPIRTTRELGAVIRQARAEAGFSQAALAEKARVGRQWLSALERGKPTAEIGLVLQVFAALDLALTADRAVRARVHRVDLDEDR